MGLSEISLRFIEGKSRKEIGLRYRVLIGSAFGQLTGSLRAAFGQPSGSLRAAYGQPTGSLRRRYVINVSNKDDKAL